MLVIGLGAFWAASASNLLDLGNDVMIIDGSDERAGRPCSLRYQLQNQGLHESLKCCAALESAILT